MLDDGDVNTDDVQTSVLYDTDSAPIGFTVNDHTYYYIKNIQGDVLCVTDETGAPLANYVYDAWGSFAFTPASQSVSNQDLAFIATYNPVTYRGYLYDPELGYYYLQSRYYDPETGRFLTPDMYADTGTGLIGTNVFAYCINSPVCFLDSAGTKPKTCIAGNRLAGLYMGPRLSVNCLDSQSGQYEVKYGNALYFVLFRRYASLMYLSVYFKHHLTVISHVVQLGLQMENEDSWQYWKDFIHRNSYDLLLITGVIEAYKKYYNCSEMFGRTQEGLVLEFYLHLYAFYFGLDPKNHTSVIDFDTPASAGIDWVIYESFDPTVFPFFNREKLIEDIRLSICSGSEKPVLSSILKTILSLKES